MENRIIQNIKKSRNGKCREKFGKKFIYDPHVDLYKLKKSVRVIKEKPFSIDDCVKESEIKYVENDNMYKNVPNEKTCKRIEGVWNGTMLSTDNKTERGLCWKSSIDMKCALKVNEVLITKPNVHKKIIDTSKKNCNKVKSCIWSKKRCLSKEGFVKNNHDYLPNDFPTNIVDDEKSALTLKASIFEDPIIKYSPLIGEGNRCLSSEFNKNEFSLAQQVVRYIGKSFAQNDTTNRGLLAWHSTGSGKTITSMAIIDSFWNSRKNIVFVSSIEALQSNPPTTFYKNAKKYFTRFENDEEKDIEKQFKKRNVKFMTFSQLAHYLLIYNPLKSVKTDKDKAYHRNFLANSVLIIDEVQNIFHPLPNQRAEHNALKSFLLSKVNDTNKQMKVFILTATPGDSIEETIDLLNIVRDRSKKPIVKPVVHNKDECKIFMKNINGLISYFNSSKDMTRFPKVVADNHYKLEMLQDHFEKYVETFNKMHKKDTNFDALAKSNAINKYYKTLRKYSNMQYNFDSKDPVAFFSNKLPKLLAVIESKSADKHYVYSAFYERKGFGGQGIRAIAQFMESELGYIRINSDKDLKKLTSGKNGYVLAITNELNNKEHLKQLVDMYNNPNSGVNVFLASQSFNEGVDLKNTKHIHVFEPMLTFNAEKQTIGRAVRFCSHASMPYDEWTTTIHRYFSVLPRDLSIYDTYKKEKNVEEIEIVVSHKESALIDIKGKMKVTQIRAELKEEIRALKKQRRTLQKEINDIHKMNVDNIVSVDELIYEESIERIYEQSIIMEMMKKKAIDCYMMQDFHKNGGEDIQCH